MIDPYLPTTAPAGRFPPARSFVLTRRAIWHAIGLLLAATTALIVFRAYREPAFIIDFGNLFLC